MMERYEVDPTGGCKRRIEIGPNVLGAGAMVAIITAIIVLTIILRGCMTDAERYKSACVSGCVVGGGKAVDCNRSCSLIPNNP